MEGPENIRRAVAASPSFVQCRCGEHNQSSSHVPFSEMGSNQTMPRKDYGEAFTRDYLIRAPHKKMVSRTLAYILVAGLFLTAGVGGGAAYYFKQQKDNWEATAYSVVLKANELIASNCQ